MKFSFIIPVYNMEKLLTRCIESVLQQTYTDWEIIAINDGSTDNSGMLLDKYKEKDPRIHVIHKDNSGISAAYKDAFHFMKGDFVCFVDSDDYLSVDMLCEISRIIKTERPDAVQFGLLKEDECEEKIGEIRFPEELVVGSDKIVQAYFEKYKFPTLSCRVYDKRLFQDLFIPSGNVGIDEVLTIQLLGKCNTLYSISNLYYHLYIRPSSVSRANKDLTMIRSVMSVEEYICKYVNENYPVCSKEAYEKAAYVLLDSYSEVDENVYSVIHIELEEKLLEYCQNIIRSGGRLNSRLLRNYWLLRGFRASFRFLRRRKHIINSLY